MIVAPAALAQQMTIQPDTPTFVDGNAGAPILRVIPQDALQARLVMAAPAANGPQTARLDSNTVGLAPGVRVFSPDMQLLNPQAIAGKKLEVRYRLDLYGQLLTAWIMTEAEYKAWKSTH